MRFHVALPHIHSLHLSVPPPPLLPPCLPSLPCVTMASHSDFKSTPNISQPPQGRACAPSLPEHLCALAFAQPIPVREGKSPPREDGATNSPHPHLVRLHECSWEPGVSRTGQEVPAAAWLSRQ